MHNSIWIEKYFFLIFMSHTANSFWPVAINRAVFNIVANIMADAEIIREIIHISVNRSRYPPTFLGLGAPLLTIRSGRLSNVLRLAAGNRPSCREIGQMLNDYALVRIAGFRGICLSLHVWHMGLYKLHDIRMKIQRLHLVRFTATLLEKKHRKKWQCILTFWGVLVRFRFDN